MEARVKVETILIGLFEKLVHLVYTGISRSVFDEHGNEKTADVRD